MAILLPPFHVNTKRRLTVEVNHDLEQDLERYRAYYRQAYGADVSDADLLREMARNFMADDRPFQEFRRGGRSRSRPPRRSDPVGAAAAGDRP